MEKMVKCPECGNVFKRPFFDIKYSHLGWTLKGTGVLDCPSCGVERPSADFIAVENTSI